MNRLKAIIAVLIVSTGFTSCIVVANPRYRRGYVPPRASRHYGHHLHGHHHHGGHHYHR